MTSRSRQAAYSSKEIYPKMGNRFKFRNLHIIFNIKNMYK